MTTEPLIFEIESTLADCSEYAMARVSGPGAFDAARVIRDALQAQGRRVHIYAVEETRRQVFGMGSPKQLLSRLRDQAGRQHD